MTVDTDEWYEIEQLAFEFEPHWLPKRPLAGPSKTSTKYRMSRERALTMPYVEANPTCMQSLIICDHDGGRADEIVGLTGLPAPSYIALNPHTKSGQLVYALATPVCLTDAARRGPVNLLARVEAGLNTALDGDVAYAGRFTKNPTHQQHLTMWGPESAVYGLKDLAGPLAELRMLPRWDTQRQQRQVLATSAVGRNVALFDLVRKWAYRARGAYDNLPDWDEVTEAYTWDRNEAIIGPAFTRGPLTMPESQQVGRSISHWTWRNIKRSFEEEQARRGRKGGQVVSDKKREANRARATKYDVSAIVASATEV